MEGVERWLDVHPAAARWYRSTAPSISISIISFITGPLTKEKLLRD